MIQLTEEAIAEIKRLQKEDPSVADARLRVEVKAGGCSGYSYQFGFDDGQSEKEHESAKRGDKFFEQAGVKMVVDSKSALFLMGSTLHFSGGLNGKGFIFNNRQAKRVCGCGSSFAV